MSMPLSNPTRLDEANSCTLSGSRITQRPLISQFRMEYAREWGPCVLGIDQAMRGPLSALGPAVFCGVIIPSVHEIELESHGCACCFASCLSVNDQERMQQMIHSDSYMAWLLRVIPSEAADGARCSMGVLEHTTAASIIKEAIAAGVDIRGIRVSASCDPMRFRQFLFEAFPMIDDICVYPRIAAISCSDTSSSGFHYLLPSSPQSLPSSPLSPMNTTSPVVPSIICAAGVLAQSARDDFSRQVLYKQRQNFSPPTKSPLSKPLNASRMRSRLTSSTRGSFFGGPMCRNRSSSENAHTANVRCAAFVGSEFADSHSGLIPEVSHQPITQSQSVPIDMYDFYDDDESSMHEFTSPKRIRVVPCSPPLPVVITSEDSLTSSSSNTTTTTASTQVPTIPVLSQASNGRNVDSFESCPFSSTSFFVSPPPCSSASTAVPMFRQMYGLTSPF